MPRKTEPAHITEKAPFPTNLRGLMKERNVTQKMLAKAIEMRPQTVSLYTTGQSAPDINCLNKIANYFNVSTDYLLGRTEAPTIDATPRAVCDYTGLSQDVVDRLHQELLSNDSTWNIGRLDSLLSSNTFWEIIGILQSLKESSAFLHAYLRFADLGVPNAADKADQKVDVRDLLRYRAQRLFDQIMNDIESEEISPIFKIKKVNTSNSGREDTNGQHPENN